MASTSTGWAGAVAALGAGVGAAMGAGMAGVGEPCVTGALAGGAAGAEAVPALVVAVAGARLKIFDIKVLKSPILVSFCLVGLVSLHSVWKTELAGF